MQTPCHRGQIEFIVHGNYKSRTISAAEIKPHESQNQALIIFLISLIDGKKGNYTVVATNCVSSAKCTIKCIEFKIPRMKIISSGRLLRERGIGFKSRDAFEFASCKLPDFNQRWINDYEWKNTKNILNERIKSRVLWAGVMRFLFECSGVKLSDCSSAEQFVTSVEAVIEVQCISGDGGRDSERNQIIFNVDGFSFYGNVVTFN